MSMTLAELAAEVGGKIQDYQDILISGANTIRDAVAGDITFAETREHLAQLSLCKASAVLINHGQVAPEPMIAVKVNDVASAFRKIVTHFRPSIQRVRVGISPQASISPTAEIADDVDIYPGATVGDRVKIGAGSILHSGVHIMEGATVGKQCVFFPNSVVYDHTEIHDHVTLHAGAVVGSYGFGYDTRDGRHERSPQLGNVIVESHVEIGANTTVDRGTYGPTRIGEGTKIDNLVQIAHNCRIGRHNFLCSQVGIAGSSTTGDYVVMAGQVGVKDHIDIGSGAVIGAQAGVMNHVPGGETWYGSPATNERLQRQILATQFRLPEMRKQLRHLQRRVDANENANSSVEATPKNEAA